MQDYSSEIIESHHKEVSDRLSFNHMPRPFGGAGVEVFNSTYDLWKTNWTQAFYELDKLKKDQLLNSDNFTKQDEILSLQLNNICIAAVCFRYLDMRLPAYQEDSYLDCWPRKFIEETISNKLIFVMSGFTIHPQFRFKVLGIPTMHLFKSYIVRFFKQSQVEHIITIVRNDVGLNKLCYLYGAKAIIRELPFNNTKVDLVCYTQSETQDFFRSKYSDRIKEIINLAYLKGENNVYIKSSKQFTQSI